MPMHSTSAVSQNNSNNKLELTSSSSDEQRTNGSVLKDVDDSPINSPELLPANSVSYHQVRSYPSCVIRGYYYVVKDLLWPLRDK